MIERFCPKCGKTINEDNNINNFCIDCFLEDNQILTIPIFEISYCSSCETYRYANRVYKNKNALETDLLKHIKIKNLKNAKISINLVIDDQKKEYFSEVTVNVLIGNKLKKITQKQNINYKKEQCIFCSRVAGDYYTSVIQLRFDTKKLQTKLLDNFRNEINLFVNNYNNSQKDIKNKVNIVKEKEENKGIDIYVNELSHAQRIVQKLSNNEYAYDTKYSKTLMGVFKNGKRKYRYTLCIHFGEIQENQT
jgi:NMD protein affecting ribosome stability and mRNA decay